MPTSKPGIKSALTSSGISRKLTLGFLSVILLVVGIALPVTLLSFERIHAASNQATRATATQRNVAVFQRKISDVRASARDLSTRDNSVTRTKMTRTLQEALDAASCIGQPSKCREGLEAGEQLPDDEARQWREIATRATSIRASFQDTMGTDRRSAVNRLDQQLERDVSQPAQALAEQVSRRQVAAQDAITREIASATGLLVGAMVAALLLAALLAAVIPRRLLWRLNHLRRVSHQLASGDLDARVNERYAKRSDEIGDLISDFNVMAMSMQRNTQELRTVQEQLHIALQQEQERATRDPLTGLRNHRYFQDSLSAELERSRRNGSQVSIAVLDLDDFKQVNDRFGHSEGDAVLRRATKGISDNLRPYDLACRLGGEEFGVIFPETTPGDAKLVLDRIAHHILPFGPNGERLSFSGGIATWPAHAESQTDLYQRADEAAYAAKMQGKACTVIYDPQKVSSMDSEERSRSRARDAMLTTATALVAAVDQKDPYTRHHSELVAIYAATVARAMRLDEATVKLVYRAGLLHDVGKIGIADDILVKGSQLTHDEWVQLRMHPEFSYRILEAAEMEPVATWTRHHHEHYDGTGYPFGLAGSDIPIGSRIVLVADAFESMTSDRVYRRSLGVAQAVSELRSGAGHQFDPLVVETMVSLVEQGVFQQVMQQHGRTIEPVAGAAPQPEYEQPMLPSATADPALAQQQAAQHEPSATARSEAEAWALQQISHDQWAQPTQAQPTPAAPAASQQQPAQPQWTQEQWDAYQQQAAQQQAELDAQLAQQQAWAQQQAQAQAQQHEQAHVQAQQPEQAQVHELPVQPEQQWAPPNPDDLAA